jgi:superfamily II DNA helicase RecQ
MKIKVFTFRFSDTADGFDDGSMQAFIVDKEVVEVSEHFFFHDKTPYLTLVLSYREAPGAGKSRSARRFDPRRELDETEKAAYEVLRAWRAAQARKEGIPPYMIAANRQLARMIKDRARSRADLTAIAGIGEAKSSRYGDAILGLLAKHLAGDPVTEKQSEGEAPS